MSQALSYDDAVHVTKRSTRRDPVAARSMTRLRKRAPAQTRVPMLDWPAELFSDNANVAELAGEDFPMQLELTQGQSIFRPPPEATR